MANTKKQIKEIPNLPDYYACEDGSIWSTKVSYRYNPNGEMRLVRPRLHPSGYLYYGIYLGKGPNKQRLWRRGHRLVYSAFFGKIPYKDKDGNPLDIDHKNHNKHDNSLGNLRLITHAENCKSKRKKKA